jgi:excisionase family DNA binding protein
MKIDLDDYLSPEAFCAQAGIARPTLQRRIADGSLTVVRVGQTLLIPRSATVERRRGGPNYGLKDNTQPEKTTAPCQ